MVNSREPNKTIQAYSETQESVTRTNLSRAEKLETEFVTNQKT